MLSLAYAMLTRHLWLVQAFGSYQLRGPGKARHDDHSIAVYEAAGFVGAEADQATSAVFTFVLGNALGLAATARLELPSAGYGAAPQDSFAFGLQAVLDGLEARLATRATSDTSG